MVINYIATDANDNTKLLIFFSFCVYNVKIKNFFLTGFCIEKETKMGDDIRGRGRNKRMWTL